MSRFYHLRDKFGPVLLATLLSQTIAAVSILLLPTVFSASQADSYALGIQTGTAGLSSIVIGITYNVAIGRPEFQSWGKAALLATVFGPALAILTWFLSTVFLHKSISTVSSAVPVLVLFGVGGGGLALGATFAVRSACLGSPVPLALTTVGPNLGLLIGMLLWKLIRADVSELLPALIWCFVAWVQVPIFIARSRSPREERKREPAEVGSHVRGHVGVLAVGVVTGAVLPNVYVAAMTQIAAGLAAIVFLVGRIGTSVVGIGVNSILLASYSWRSRPSGSKSILEGIVSVSAISGALGSILRCFGVPDLVAYAFLVAMWLLLLIASALALREINARKEVRTLGVKTLFDVLVSLPLAAFFVANPSISGFFGVYSVSQVITLLAASRSLKSKRLMYAGAVSMVPALLAVLVGW